MRPLAADSAEPSLSLSGELSETALLQCQHQHHCCPLGGPRSSAAEAVSGSRGCVVCGSSVKYVDGWMDGWRSVWGCLVYLRESDGQCNVTPFLFCHSKSTYSISHDIIGEGGEGRREGEGGGRGEGEGKMGERGEMGRGGRVGRGEGKGKIGREGG